MKKIQNRKIILLINSNFKEKFDFYPNFFSYRSESNFKKFYYYNKLRIIFREKDSPQLDRFQFLKINSL